jgi:hypothetical protein
MNIKTSSKKQGPSADIQDPNFFLQRKVGGPASRALNPLNIARAEAALLKMMPTLDQEVARLVKELQRVLKMSSIDARNIIWAHAHELRGLAGTAAKMRLGEAANIICLYLNGTDPEFRPDAKLLSTIAVVVLLAVKEDADLDPMVEMLIADSLKAVDVQRQREGRPPL